MRQVYIAKSKFRQYCIFPIFGLFIKFNAHQIFLLYGIHTCTCASILQCIGELYLANLGKIEFVRQVPKIVNYSQ